MDAMIAKQKSRCRLCGGRIDVGDDISPIGKQSWGHQDCVERSRRR